MFTSLQDQKNRLHKLLNSCPDIKWKENKCERYPVTKSGIKKGSLWFRITKGNATIFVSTSGDATQHMSEFITKCAGNPSNIDKAHRDWKNVSFENVGKITEKFNSL